MSRVLVPLAQGCEELEAITITDLLVRANIEVITAGLDDQPVIASRGAVITPNTRIDNIQDELYDMIVLPGGLPGADHLRDDERVQALIKKHADNNKYVAAICAAPQALASAGILQGKRATAYPGTLEKLNDKTIEICNSAIEIDGNVVTSRGPGTAMDFALTLVELLEGLNTRNTVNNQLLR